MLQVPFENCRDVEEEVCEEVSTPQCSRVEFDDCQTVIKNRYEPGLPDAYSQIFRLYVFGPSGLKDYGSTTLHCKI